MRHCEASLFQQTTIPYEHFTRRTNYTPHYKSRRICAARNSFKRAPHQIVIIRIGIIYYGVINYC